MQRTDRSMPRAAGVMILAVAALSVALPPGAVRAGNVPGTGSVEVLRSWAEEIGSQAIDSRGRSVIATIRTGHGQSLRLRREGATWSDEEVVPLRGEIRPEVGLGLVLDASDAARVVFEQGDEVRLARETPGGWQVESLDPGGVTGRPAELSDAPLAIDAAGALHVAWTTPRGAFYATNATGRWVTERLGLPRYARDSRIAVANGTVGIVSEVAGDGVYLERKGQGWASKTFPEAWRAAVTIDRHGRPHLAWAERFATSEEHGLRVRHATRGRDGSWRTSTVHADPGYTASVGGVAVSGTGTVHVAINERDGLLHAASAGTGWRTTVVSTLPDTSWSDDTNTPLDIDLDGRGRARILISRGSMGSSSVAPGLLVASRNDGGWVTHQVVGSHVVFGIGASIAETGSVSLGYERVGYGIYLRSDRHGRWVTQRIPTVGEPRSASFVLAEGLARVVHAHEDRVVMAVEQRDGRWRTETVYQLAPRYLYVLGVTAFVREDRAVEALLQVVDQDKAMVVLHARRLERGWAVNRVPLSADARILSVATDARGNTHVVWNDPRPGIRYATDAAGSWRSERITTGAEDWASGLELGTGVTIAAILGRRPYLLHRTARGWTREPITVEPGREVDGLDAEPRRGGGWDVLMSSRKGSASDLRLVTGRDGRWDSLRIGDATLLGGMLRSLPDGSRRVLASGFDVTVLIAIKGATRVL